MSDLYPMPDETPLDFARRVVESLTDDVQEQSEVLQIILPWTVPPMPRHVVQQIKQALRMLREPAVGDIRVMGGGVYTYDGAAWHPLTSTDGAANG